MIRANYPQQEELQRRFKYINGKLYHIDSMELVHETIHLSTNKYKSIYYDNKNLCSHRMIYILVNGDIDDSLDIDHIDRDPHNNRIENLRACTRSLNSCNAKPRPNSKTGVRGVYRRKSGMFSVTVCGFYIGQWSTIEEALRVRTNYIKDNVK